MFNLRLTTIFISALLLSCSPEPVSLEVSPEPAAVSGLNGLVDETQRFNDWLDEQWEEQLRFSPQTQTSLGLKTDYNRLDDYTLAAQDAEIGWLRESVAEMESEFNYQTLSDEGKLSWDMWKDSLTVAEEGIPFRNHQYLFGRGGIHARLPNFLINLHSVETLADMEAYIARLKEIDRVLNEVLLKAQQNAIDGKRPPGFAYDFAIAEIDRIIEGAPFNATDTSPNSPLWIDTREKIDSLEANGLIDPEAAE